MYKHCSGKFLVNPQRGILVTCCEGGIGISVGGPSFKSEFSISLVRFSSKFFILAYTFICCRLL